MQASPITIPSAPPLFSLSLLISLVLSSTCFVSVLIVDCHFFPVLLPHAFSLCRSVIISFCLFSFFISRSVVNILSRAQTPA